jgi:hypothetical protein
LIRSTIRNIDPRLGVDLNQQTMAELTSASVATPRFNTFVLSAFAAVALAWPSSASTVCCPMR